MKINRNISLLILVVIGLMSCADNQIYFDMDEQCIRTCNGKAIRNLTIDDVEGDYLYRFVKDKDKEGTNRFSFISVNKNYTLEVMGQELPLNKFNLKPNSEYRIRNSTYGDAASGEIKIKTNDDGKVATANIISCK